MKAFKSNICGDIQFIKLNKKQSANLYYNDSLIVDDESIRKNKIVKNIDLLNCVDLYYIDPDSINQWQFSNKFTCRFKNICENILFNGIFNIQNIYDVTYKVGIFIDAILNEEYTFTPGSNQLTLSFNYMKKLILTPLDEHEIKIGLQTSSNSALDTNPFVRVINFNMMEIGQ